MRLDIQNQILNRPCRKLMQFDHRVHHIKNGFKNPEPGFEEKNFLDLLKWGIIDRLRGSRPRSIKKYSFPVKYNRKYLLHTHTKGKAITWIGHTTFLITIDGITILTDPIWSERASPFRFMGPKRWVPPGVPFDDLPEIDIVLISHNHYDHLDSRTIERLGKHPKYFIPSKLMPFFQKRKITNIEEYDWWDKGIFNTLRITATPAQHFSGRGLWDRNKSLWCGWVVESDSFKLYFAGDSGYFSGFKEIGRRFGDFDMAIIPIGAYLPRWFMKPVHMSPAEAVQAYLDVNAQIFVASHWGTFDLADEPLDDPPQRLREEIDRLGLNRDLFWIPSHGETLMPEHSGIPKLRSANLSALSPV